MNKKEIEAYFKCDKSENTGWYTINTKGKKQWDQSKVSKFWKLIRSEKMANKDYHFDDFSFPKFEDSNFLRPRSVEKDVNFWLKGQEKQFDKDVFFSNVKFCDCVEFYNYIFLSNVHFYSTVFSDEGTFTFAHFYGKVKFSRVKFENQALFNNTYFSKQVEFYSSTFTEESDFNYSCFENKITFDHTSFNKSVAFKDAHFKQVFEAGYSTFNGAVKFYRTDFVDFEFNQVIFNESVDFTLMRLSGEGKFLSVSFSENYRSLFQDVCKLDTSKVTYEQYRPAFSLIDNHYLNSLTYKSMENPVFFENFDEYVESSLKEKSKFFEPLQELDLEERKRIINLVKYNQCFVLDVKMMFFGINFSPKTLFIRTNFKQVIFTQSNLSEVQLRDCEWGEYKGRLYLEEENHGRYRLTETLYRQLKRNFDKNKNWELSGKAYVSEMEMRKSRLWKEKDYLSWFIYRFYAFFGYTQSFKTPLKWYLAMTFIIFPIYYYFSECISFGWIYQVNFSCSFFSAWERSIAASFPLIDTKLSYNNWWVQSFQKVLGTTLLTFFILALRKRFKQ